MMSPMMPGGMGSEQFDWPIIQVSVRGFHLFLRDGKLFSQKIDLSTQMLIGKAFSNN